MCCVPTCTWRRAVVGEVPVGFRKKRRRAKHVVARSPTRRRPPKQLGGPGRAPCYSPRRDASPRRARRTGGASRLRRNSALMRRTQHEHHQRSERHRRSDRHHERGTTLNRAAAHRAAAHRAAANRAAVPEVTRCRRSPTLPTGCGPGCAHPPARSHPHTSSRRPHRRASRRSAPHRGRGRQTAHVRASCS